MTTLAAALADLLQNNQLSVDAAAERHITDTFRQSTNGHWDDRATFLAQIAQLRGSAAEIGVTVLDEVVDGKRYAERHIVEVVDSAGVRLTHEVFLFATLADDGRFNRIEEITRVVDAESRAAD